MAKLLAFPNVPYMLDEANGVYLSETKSIMKYIAVKYDRDLLGRDATEIATADMISRVHDDWYN